jgi:hypothetical protein
VFSGGALLLGYALLVWAMGMMNRPSDIGLYGGLGIVLGLIAVLPLVMLRIWRRGV